MSNPFLANSTPSAANTVITSLVSTFVPGANTILPDVTGLLGSQSFANIPVANSRAALYTLSIRAAGSPALAYASYTFPITPGGIVKEYTAMANIFDVAGSSSIGGVQRVVDEYGASPVTYHIEGTTGWQMHASDGYAYDGVSSMLQLQQMLQLYASLNANQININQPLYTMEFYDYFTGDYWQVEPVGRQEFRQSREKPLYIYYSLHLAGVSNLANPILQQIDQLLSLFSQSPQTAITALAGIAGSVLNDYAPITPGAYSIPSILNSISDGDDNDDDGIDENDDGEDDNNSDLDF